MSTQAGGADEGKRRGGRPTKCTPELIEAFARYMAAGLYLEEAAALCEIAPVTAWRWFRWGEEALDAADNELDDVPEEQRPYATFCKVVRAAEARAISANVAVLQQGSRDRRLPNVRAEGRVLVDADGAVVIPGDWRAAEAFLRMRKPETWGARRQMTELSGPGGGPVQISWIDQLKAAFEGEAGAVCADEDGDRHEPADSAEE